MSRLHCLAAIFLILGLSAACVASPAPVPTKLPTSRPSPTTQPVAPLNIETETPKEPAAATPTILNHPGATPQAVSPTVTVPSSLPPMGAILGMELDNFSTTGLKMAKDAGAYWLRRNALRWDLVEPQSGVRDWNAVASLDSELESAAAAGFQVLLVVRGTPSWAQAVPGVVCGPARIDALPALAAFLGDAVARYSQAPYHVLYWELGNEPDIDQTLINPDSPFGCLGQAGDPYYGGAAYAEVLRTAYPLIKAANPDAQVLIGGLLMDCDPQTPPTGKDCTPSQYLEGILQAGGGNFFDGVSFHAYDYYQGQGRYANSNWHSSINHNGPVLIVKANFLRQRLAEHNFVDKFLINSEAGLLCGRDGSEPECQTDDFEKTKAAYIAETSAAAYAAGLRANLWYSLTGWRGTALVATNFTPKPAFHALQVAGRQLDGATFVAEIHTFPEVRGWEFNRDGMRLVFLASKTGLPVTIHLDSLPDSVEDVLGSNIDPAIDLTVGPLPVWIVWQTP